MSEYRDNDNKEFLDLIDLVQEKLKGTNYKMFISINEPDVEWDAEHPHEDWLDYDKYDKNPAFKNHRIDFSGWGQEIAILDPDTQAPHKISKKEFHYKHALLAIWQDYEHYSQYDIIRNASYMYDVIHYGQTTNPDYEEKYITYENVVKYVENDLLNDLRVLSEATKKLAEIHANDKALAELKYKKYRYDEDDDD